MRTIKYKYVPIHYTCIEIGRKLEKENGVQK